MLRFLLIASALVLCSGLTLFHGGAPGSVGTGSTLARPWNNLSDTSLNTATAANANATIGTISIPGSGSFSGSVFISSPGQSLVAAQQPNPALTIFSLSPGTGCSGSGQLITCSGATLPGPVATLKVAGSNLAPGFYPIDIIPSPKAIVTPTNGASFTDSEGTWTMGTAVSGHPYDYNILLNGVTTGGGYVEFQDMFGVNTALAAGGTYFRNSATYYHTVTPSVYRYYISVSTGSLSPDGTSITPYSGASITSKYGGNLQLANSHGWFGNDVQSGGTVIAISPQGTKLGVYNNGINYIKAPTNMPSPGPATKCYADQPIVVSQRIVAGDGNSFTDGSGNVWSFQISGSLPYTILKGGVTSGGAGDFLYLGTDGVVYTESFLTTSAAGPPTGAVPPTPRLFSYGGTSWTETSLPPHGFWRVAPCPGGF